MEGSILVRFCFAALIILELDKEAFYRRFNLMDTAKHSFK